MVLWINIDCGRVVSNQLGIFLQKVAELNASSQYGDPDLYFDFGPYPERKDHQQFSPTFPPKETTTSGSMIQIQKNNPDLATLIHIECSAIGYTVACRIYRECKN